MQNFNDILNGVTDGTKNLSISALTCAGTATLNGDVNIGDASADTLTILASLGGTIPVKTDVTYDFGSTSKRLRYVYAQDYYGIQTNTAAPSGYLGEVISSSVSAATESGVTAGNWGNITSINLTAGRWLIIGSIQNTRISGQAEFFTAISAYASNTTTDHVTGQNVFQFVAPPASSGISTITAPIFAQRLTGNATYYLKGKLDAGTWQTGNFAGTLLALRL